MKRTLLFSILCLCLHFPALGQELRTELETHATKLAGQIDGQSKKKVAVLDFTDLQGGASELGRFIAEELTVNMVSGKREFALLDRANLARVLSEHKLTAQGLVDPENAKKLGQFSGVDALVLGTIVPLPPHIQLSAKIITTDTAEIVGAAKATFKTDHTIDNLLAQKASLIQTEDSQPRSSPSKAVTKPFGDLVARVESLRMLPSSNDDYGFAKLTIIISNTSPSVVYGVALEGNPYDGIKLSNSRDEDFKATEVVGLETDFAMGSRRNAMTEILPRNAAVATIRLQVPWDGKPGDYRPYRLQAMLAFRIESKGDFEKPKKHNLVIDIP